MSTSGLPSCAPFALLVPSGSRAFAAAAAAAVVVVVVIVRRRARHAVGNLAGVTWRCLGRRRLGDGEEVVVVAGSAAESALAVVDHLFFSLPLDPLSFASRNVTDRCETWAGYAQRTGTNGQRAGLLFGSPRSGIVRSDLLATFYRCSRQVRLSSRGEKQTQGRLKQKIRQTGRADIRGGALGPGASQSRARPVGPGRPFTTWRAG
ncbi:hypothetical protein CISG_08223 [Coccidioides immitis RMSCC 3703]|uniref:Uncharacterized protein n=1 Tax=Coccidioides immitis RMSCC 3703 TaxID=454286 RepID=A0A0J8R574_COCIT|nr:hypothetical protein CISG_08223 [Coccidioides immitis RMSCC 3703]